MLRSRLLVSTLLAALSLGAFAPAVLGAGATTETYRLSFEHTDDHGYEAYHFDVDTVVHITTRPDGTTSISNNTKQIQTHTVGDVVVDVVESNMAEHSLVDGELVIQSHNGGHHRYTADGEACQTTAIFQVVDQELVLQQFQSVCH
jgi:hypothetical protein